MAEFIDICPELGVTGLSVTIPHKETILKMINALDDNVAGIRAANTVVFRDANTYGFNTDCEAAIRSLQRVVRPELPREERLRGRRILILGAGGVARAVAFGLHRAGAKVHLCARDYRKSEKLAFEFGCESLDWPARQKLATDILINCTPVGMHPNLDESPFEQGWFDKRMTVFDTVYNPEQTLFIKLAKEAGCETITGVDMFVEQAARQFKLFTGKSADRKLMRTVFKQAISPARYR